MADYKEPQPVTIKGNELRCPVCSNGRFWEQQAQMNTAVMTFLNLDWANSSATCYICSSCTHVSWFLKAV